MNNIDKKESIVSFRNVSVSFKEVNVLKDLSFDIYPGEIVTIAGPSGSGKSTILKILGKIIQIDSGEIKVSAQRLGMAFQKSALFNSMTVGENVAVPLKEHTDLSPEIIRIIVRVKLELVGLTGFEDFMPYQISGGMKKRVALARAIALDPKIVFYDEPGAGLDPITASMIDRLILDLSKKLNITSVVVSHEMKSAFRIADKIIILHKGKVLQVGSAEEIQHSKDSYVQQFIQGESEGVIPFKQTSEAYLKGLLST